jgi:hypothetical protein
MMGEQHSLGRRLRAERGDVLMEYVIVTVFILLPLIGAATGLFSPAGRTFTVGDTIAGDDFGIIGNALVEVYRKIMCGIALPIP